MAAVAAQGVSRQVMMRAAGVGIAAGVMGTWVEMSHGVICMPVLALPPISLSHQAAVGTTVFGVAARQVISATLYAVDPNTDLDDVESLHRIMDVPAAMVLALSSTAAALGAAALASKMSYRQTSKCNGAFLIGLSVFLYWRETRLAEAEEEAARVAGPLPEREREEWEEEPIPGALGPAVMEPVRLVRSVQPSAARDDLPRLLGMGLASGVVLGFFGIGPAWILAPLLTHTAKTGQLGALVQEDFGPKLEAVSSLGPFCTDERTRTTACMAMVPPSIAAALRHWSLGNVPHPGALAMPLAAGAILGSAIGGQALRDVPCERDHRQVIAGLLFVHGMWTFIRPLFAA